MRRSFLFVVLLNICICFNGRGQNLSNQNSVSKEWESEIERIVFNDIVSYDTDSTSFVEAFLIFKVKAGNVIEDSYLLFGKIQIDSIAKISKLYSHPFLLSSLQKHGGNNSVTFFIQPILFGKTKDINNTVIDPPFYLMSTIPMSPVFNDRDNSTTIFLFSQINYTYRVGR